MPRVLRIINRFNIGGPTYNAAILTRYLNNGYETKLIGGLHQESESSSNYILEGLGIEGEIIPSMKREFNLSDDRHAYREIRKVIKAYKPDIIHTHASKAGAIGRAAGINYRKAKMIHTFHGHVFHSYFGKVKTNVYKTIERGLAKKTDKIIAISDIQKRELVNQFRICSADKVEVIPLGFDLEKFYTDTSSKRKMFREKYQLADDEVAVGIVGRLTQIKNHHLFLKAFQITKNKSKNAVRAFIIGDGEEKDELTAYCDQLGLTYASTDFMTDVAVNKADVHFISWVKDMDIPYAGVDIVALSSNNEGTPVSLIEAQAASKPIVSTEVGGVADIVIRDKTALLSKARNTNEFAKQMLRLVEDSSLRNELSVCSKEFAIERFHYNRLVNDIYKLYESVLH